MSCEPFSAVGLTIDWCDWTWSWTLAGNASFRFHILICIVYAVSVKLLQVYVSLHNDYKAPKWLEPFRKIHNLLLAFVSFVMFIVMTVAIVLDGRLSSWSAAACQMTPMKGMYGFINFVYLVSKLWEWVDTYILVLSNKPVITLHWFHHMTTFTMSALTHNFPVGGFALINCLVHTVMYMHYYRPVRWARPFITSSQLLQFMVVISIHVYGYLNPATCFDMRPVFHEWLFCFTVVFGFFVMFLMFFVQEYLAPKASGRSSRPRSAADVRKAR